PTRQRIAPIVSTVLDDYRPIATARSITLTVQCDDKLEGAIDRTGLARVLGNLLSNALKFTPKGGQVTVAADERKGDLHVIVRDTGSGMEPAEVQRIFERFSRLERHRDVAGTGIGLFVLKSIVSAHGGNVTVTSKVGEGTSFELVFPAHPPVN